MTISQSYIQDILKYIKFYDIFDYIKLTLIPTGKGRLYLSFYNTLFHTDYVRINSILNLDVSYAILTYYYL